MGIRHIGERAAGLLADRFGSLDRLMAADLEEIRQVNGIGPRLAQSAYEFLAEPRNRTVIEKLRSAGVRMADLRAGETGERPLLGLTVVLTGRFSAVGRAEAEDRLRRLGANTAGSVSKKTSAVVAGEDAGSKENRARELGIPLLGEPDLIAMLRGERPDLPAVNGLAKSRRAAAPTAEVRE